MQENIKKKKHIFKANEVERLNYGNPNQETIHLDVCPSQISYRTKNWQTQKITFNLHLLYKLRINTNDTKNRNNQTRMKKERRTEPKNSSSNL